MATADYILANKGQYYKIAEAGEDFFASNASQYVVDVRTGPDQPDDKKPGHNVNPSDSIVRDPASDDAVWVMCASAGGALVVKN